MKVVSCFSGIGLLDQGLIDAGNDVVMQCEKEPVQLKILQATFPNIFKHNDIPSLQVHHVSSTAKPILTSQAEQPLNSSPNSLDSPISVDLASCWLRMSKDSLKEITEQTGYHQEWQKLDISAGYSVLRQKLSVPHTDEIEYLPSTVGTGSYLTPTASAGTWRTLQLTGYFKRLHPEFGTIVSWPNPELAAWLMGLEACPNLLRNVWRLSGMGSCTMLDSSSDEH